MASLDVSLVGVASVFVKIRLGRLPRSKHDRLNPRSAAIRGPFHPLHLRRARLPGHGESLQFEHSVTSTRRSYQGRVSSVHARFECNHTSPMREQPVTR